MTGDEVNAHDNDVVVTVCAYGQHPSFQMSQGALNKRRPAWSRRPRHAGKLLGSRRREYLGEALLLRRQNIDP